VALPSIGAKGQILTQGVIAGLIATTVFVIYLAITFAVTHGSPWTPFNLIAHSFWRGAPTDGAFSIGALLLGLVATFLVGVVLALIFAVVMANIVIGPLEIILVTTIVSNVLWVLGHYLIWPALDAEAAEEFTHLTAWLGHALYGLVVGVVLAVMSAGRRPSPRA